VNNGLKAAFKQLALSSGIPPNNSAGQPDGVGKAGVVSIASAGVAVKVIATVGDGVTTSIILNHNLGTQDVVAWTYYAAAPFGVFLCDPYNTDINNTTLVFQVAPGVGAVKVVLIG
jgi:hypothetical protein